MSREELTNMAFADLAAEEAYAQRVRNEWTAKIASSTTEQLLCYLYDLNAPLVRSCETVFPQARHRFKLQGSETGTSIDLDKLQSLLMKSIGQDPGILDLLRLSILIAIINQLKRQLQGLI